jgi:DnaJ-class molecular chaperone
MDYYNILGVQPSASDTEIKKAWRSLSFKYHPDKNTNTSDQQKNENEKKIKEINEAYETLKDPVLRRQYDNRNANPFQQMFGDMFQNQNAFRPHHMQNPMQNPMHMHMNHPMMNIFDIINELHGQQGEPIVFTTMYDTSHQQQPHQQPTPPQPPQPIEIKLDLTLQQAFTGTQMPIMIEREIKTGNNSYREQERIYVNIPPGIDTNEIITIPEKGSDNNGIKGDIKIQICLRHHEVFERHGLNLIYKHTITFKESILGFDFVLNYIDDTSFKVKNIRGSIIQNLEEKIIKGKGFTRDGSTGDLVIVFKVVPLKPLTEEQLSALESIL